VNREPQAPSAPHCGLGRKVNSIYDATPRGLNKGETWYKIALNAQLRADSTRGPHGHQESPPTGYPQQTPEGKPHLLGIPKDSAPQEARSHNAQRKSDHVVNSARGPNAPSVSL